MVDSKENNKEIWGVKGLKEFQSGELEYFHFPSLPLIIFQEKLTNFPHKS